MAHRFTMSDLRGKVEWDDNFVEVDKQMLERFIVGYANYLRQKIFGPYLVEKWFRNPDLRFRFKYFDMPGRDRAAATGKSWTITLEVLFEDSDRKAVWNRAAQVLTVEMLHAMMRYLGFNKAEEMVENVMERRKKYVKIHVGRKEFLEGLNADAWYGTGLFGYKFRPVSR